MTWEKVGKRIGPEGTTITYRAKQYPAIEIESRKRHIPHANGIGTWDHTSYFVLLDGVELIEKQNLRDAREFAELLAVKRFRPGDPAATGGQVARAT